MNNSIEKQEQVVVKQRESGLELLRIITMLLIVAHHYVVNSGLLEQIQTNPLANHSIFLLIFGAFGKTGINCFVLITGYFMCKSSITLKKFLQLFIQIKFYRILFYLIFLISGYMNFNLASFTKTLLPIWNINKNFTSCFLILFLSIPFLNILITNMNQKLHRNLLYLTGFVYVFMGSIPKFTIQFNYVTWFCIIYFIGAYIRLYPPKIFERYIIRSSMLFISLLLSTLSIIIFHYISYKYNLLLWDFWLSDCNKILAVITSISAFVFFKYLKIPYNKTFNIVASTTFGILLIHANSDTMRQWLWKDFLNNIDFYNTEYIYLHSFLSVIFVFTVCSLIDYLRQIIFTYFYKTILKNYI